MSESKKAMLDVEVTYFVNSQENEVRVVFNTSNEFKCVYQKEIPKNVKDIKYLQELYDGKGFPVRAVDIQRAFEAYERHKFVKTDTFFVKLASDTIQEDDTEKKPLTNIVLPEVEAGKEYIPKKEYFLDTGILEPIKAGIMLNMPSLLVGETGVGKTSCIRHLAAETGNGFRRVNLNGSTNVDDFVGRWKLNKDREMVWIDGVLVECMKKGLWLLCDEINACLPEISFVLHSVLDDDRYVVLTGKDNEIVTPHKDFRFFASMNPEYAGTHSLNLALQDRFGVVVHVEYPSAKQELQILLKKTKNDNERVLSKMIQVANKCRNEYKKEAIGTPFSTRRLIDWAQLATIFGNGKAYALTVLNKAASKEDQVALKDIASVVFSDAEFKQALVI